MSDSETALCTRLAANSAITDLVGDRISPQDSAQGGVFPALTYQVINNKPDHAFDGATGTSRKRIQFNCKATKYSDAKAMAEALRLSLDGYAGMPAGTDVVFQSVMKVDERDFFNQPIDAGSKGVREIQVDFAVVYLESAPLPQ